jgi:hypothetical protein
MATRDWSRAWRSPWLLSLAFLLSLPAVTQRLNASDEIEYYAWLRSAVFDRDADFENEYQHFYDANGARDAGFHETFLERRNENGRRHNFAPVGTAILWSPFFAVAHVAAGLTGHTQDGYSRPYIAAVTLASAIYGWLALLLSLGIVRRLTGQGTSAAWLVWLGTPLLFYMYVAPGFSHACSAFSVALMFWVWLRVRDRWSIAGSVCLGAVAGLLPMVREQDVFFLVAPAIDFLAWALWTRKTAPLRSSPAQAFTVACVGLAALAVVYSPQLYAYSVLNGHLGPDATVGAKMNWAAPHLLSVLFSPRHGLFAWTPLAAVAIIGLFTLAVCDDGSTKYEVQSTKYQVRTDTQPHADIRWIAALALLAVALQAYISGSVESWTVAGSFGQRRFTSLTPLLALGLAALGRKYEVRRDAGVALGKHRTSYFVLRTLYFPLVVLCLWWNLGLIAQFGLHMMNRQQLMLAENARVTFFELPLRAPSIAWRYLTDRESFYRLPRR